VRWDHKDGWDRRVVKDTGWRFIENYETFEERAGIYLFANVDLQVKYVGKAGAGRIVAEIESAIRRGKDHGATQVKVLYTNSSAAAQDLETYLIRKYEPVNNYTF